MAPRDITAVSSLDPQMRVGQARLGRSPMCSPQKEVDLMLGHIKSVSEPIACNEEEPSLRVKFDGDRVEEVELKSAEPTRLIANDLVGKDPREAPAVIERLWGKCPVSYQIPACEALEAAMGVEVTSGIRQLRRLLYCGEWIRSHALHVHLLAPNLAAELPPAADRRTFEHCLRLKQVGESLVAALGASSNFPINIAVGGFHRAPRAHQLADLRPELEWAVEASVEVLQFVSGLELPGLDVEYVDYEMVCLHHADRYPMNEGHVISSRGLVVPVSQYEARFSGSGQGHGAPISGDWIPRETSYLVGPLARVNMSLHQLSATARREAEACGIRWPSGNIFHSLVARAIETIHACEEAIVIIDRYQRDLAVPCVKVEPRAGKGCYAAEVPSGLAYHCYRVSQRGLIAEARIITPSAQNRKQAEQDLRAYLPRLGPCSPDEVARRCRQFVRNYDPDLDSPTREPEQAGR